MAASPPTRRSIKRLHLDELNPRLGRPAVSSEQEAASRLLEEFGSKIFALAKSIAQHGLNPTESWAIVQEDGRYVVLEGNRRLVACRLLERPDKDPTEKKEWKAAFERIKRDVVGEEYLRPSCVVFDRRADARYWIHIKHHGAGKGEATAGWGPEMIYLDQLNNGGEPVEWNELWYWLEETYQSDPRLAGLIHRARHEQYTLMERVYWDLKQRLCAELAQHEGGARIEVGVDAGKVKPFIEALITGMLTSSKQAATDGSGAVVISSRTLNDRASAQDLLGGLWHQTIGDDDVTAPRPTPAPTGPAPSSAVSSRQLSAPSPSSQPPLPGHAEVAADAGASARPASASPRNSNRKPKRETHLYHGVSRSNMPPRLDRLLKECAKLEISASPETASVMSRVAVELAVDALIKHHSLQIKKQRPDLVDKITAVLRHLDPKLDAKPPARPDLAGTWAAIRHDKADGHLGRDLNNCVHSYEFTAAHEIAERANRLLTPLLNAINEDLGKPPGSSVATP